MRKGVSTNRLITTVAATTVIPVPVRIGARITSGTAVQSPGVTIGMRPVGAGVESLCTIEQRRSVIDK